MSGTKEQGKHTPGPWREGEGGMLSRLNVWAGAAYQIAQVKRFPAADVVRQIRADAEAEANARLIAAAPDLLEACLARIDEWHADTRNFTRKEPKSLSMMRAAVLKAAEGK